jgi:hypothetical protein
MDKDEHLRSPRLRRSSATRNASSSGEHSLTGVEIAGTVSLPMSSLLIGAGSFLRLGGSLPEEKSQKDHHLRSPRLRRSSATRNASSSGEHSLTGVEIAGTVSLPMSSLLIGAGSFLRLGGSLPEEKSQKDHHLRPRRLRRSSASRNASSSGEHSLTGVEIAGTVCLPMSSLLIRAGSFLRLGGSLPEEKSQKDHHLRPRRLRRSSASRNASSSGEHSLTGVEIAGTVCLPMSSLLIRAGSFLRLGGSLPEEKSQKDHHLRPRRLRRSSASRNASSSGEHSLTGV